MILDDVAGRTTFSCRVFCWNGTVPCPEMRGVLFPPPFAVPGRKIESLPFISRTLAAIETINVHLMNEPFLENLKSQLFSSMNALKQQEQALETSLKVNEQEQTNIINQYKSELNIALSSLSSIPPTFAKASKTIECVYNCANTISWRIKEVDTAISRSTEATDHVRHFADLAECLSSIDSAIEAKDIAKCCDYLRRLLQIPNNLLTPENIEKIESSRKQTLVILQEMLETENDPSVIFNYYSDCGAQAEGVRKFADLQFKQILEETNQARTSIIQYKDIASATDEQRAPHVEGFVKLLNCISQHILTSLQILVEPGQYSVFIRLLLDRTDSKMQEILDQYTQYRNIQKLEQTPINQIKLSLLDLVNDEISNFAHQFSLFENFVKSKLKNGIHNDFFTSYQFLFSTIANTGMPQHTNASRAIMTLLMEYAVFTQNYVTSVTADLLNLIAGMTNTEVVTNAIDDLFFVVLRTLNRTIITRSALTTCTIFNLITPIIKEDLSRSITQTKQRRFVDIQSRSVFLNACQALSVYLDRLSDVIDNKVMKQFVDDDLAAIKSGLQDIRQVASDIKDSLNQQFDELMKTVQLDSLYKPFGMVQFSGQISIEIETQLEEQFASVFNSKFVEYKNCLNQINYDSLLYRISSIFTKTLEIIIQRKQFDETGGVLFKRIIQWLRLFFKNPPHFQNLMDISTILALNQPEDVQQYWGSRATVKDPIKMSIPELQKILRLRIDWKNADLSFLAND